MATAIPTFKSLDNKRAAQLSELTRITNEFNKLEPETVSLCIVEQLSHRLDQNQAAHQQIINTMLDYDEAEPTVMDPKVAKFHEPFNVIKERIDRLLKCKSHLARCSKLTTQLKKLTDKLQLSIASINSEESLELIPFLLKDVEPLKGQYEQIFDQLASETFDDEIMEELMTSELQFMKLYNSEIKMKLQQFKPTAPEFSEVGRDREAMPHSTFAEPKLKLPPLDLPKFDGTAANWITYRDTFKSMVHENTSLSGSVKFRYLKNTITDKMSPVAHLLESDAGYPSAWEAVLRYYDDNRKIVDHHIAGLITLKKMSGENHDDLQKLLNEVNIHTEALDRLIEPQDWKEVVIANIVNHRLDQKTRDLFETEKIEEIPRWSSMKIFLEKRRKTLSSMPIFKSAQKPAHIQQQASKPSWKPTTSNVVSNSFNGSNKGKCMICSSK